MADGGVPWPSELELKLNLNAIKKCDQFVVNIIDSASQVALYKFKSDTQAWEKTDVEGALFVYIRSSHPKHSLFIMNRLNMNNIMEPITKEMEFKQQDPFLLYKNKTSGIYGIWFYDAQECSRLCNLLIKLSLEEITPSKRPTSNPEFKANIKTPKKQEQVDILSMLTSAQKQFEKRSSEEAAPLEQKPAAALENQKQQFLQQNQDQVNQLKQLIRGDEQRKPKQRTYSSPVPYKASPTASTISAPFPNMISENGFSENQRNKGSPKTQGLPGQMFSSPDRPVQRKLFQGEKQDGNDGPPKAPDQGVTLAASLMSPLAFKTTNSPASQPRPAASQKPEISPLTPDQLVQAMAYLLKNDSDFIKKLHEAYLKSLHEMLPT